MGRQREFKFRTWGGARKGAGRKPRDSRAGVSHLRRADFPHRFPVHVTVRLRSGLPSLRSQRRFGVIARAFWAGGDKFGFRLVHYSVQGNHFHLLAEARGKQSLARGMQGLGVRIARGLNRLIQRRGRVLGDRYHARILRSPTEVKRVLHYLADNARRHYRVAGDDPFASSAPLFPPDTYLVSRQL